MANRNIYVVSYIIIGIVQGMIYAYFYGTITTVEKVFGISSRTMGFLLTGNDISQILCGMAVTHFGGKGSRPLWIAIGMLLTAASCFMYASSQLFWDGQVVAANSVQTEQLEDVLYDGLCVAQNQARPDAIVDPDVVCIGGKSNVASMALFFIGQFVSGIGSTALFSLGFTYMDDNIKKRHSPLYIGATVSLRSLGPSLGYILSSFCLKLYIDPSAKHEFSQEDPRWLGAWWLGFLIIGTLQVLIAFPMLLFPKRLPTDSKVNPNPVIPMDAGAKRPPRVSPFKDFLLSLRRQFKNPILVFHMASMGPLILGLVGFSTFMPKYLEAQFGQSASRANIFTGVSGTFMMMIGIFLGGIVIWKFKPRTFYITLWNACLNFQIIIALFIIMNFDCDSGHFSGIDKTEDGLQVTSSCSRECNCELKFDPICVMGTRNFLSPCLAGCTSFNETSTPSSSKVQKVFYNCDCFMDATNQSTATSGYCPNTRGNCPLLLPYIITLAITKFLGSTARVGSIIVLIRSVAKPDKALAMALMGVIASIFGFIPGPIVFGTMADSTCLLWETRACGQRGNCWLYDVDKLRLWYHVLLAICFFVSGIFDVLVCVYSRGLDLYNEDSIDVIPNYRLWKPKLRSRTATDETILQEMPNQNEIKRPI